MWHYPQHHIPIHWRGPALHCGLPEFTLTCRDNAFPEFTSNSVTYRVLQLDQTRNTMNLSRSDLYNNTCPSEFHNSTLNSTLFDDEGMENEVLNLIYGCNTSVMPLRPYNLFSCNSSGDNFNNAFYLIGPVPNDPILRIIYCNVSISVPILRAAGDRLTGLNISLEEALMQGFSVNYSDPYESNCSECNRFGGQCGFDSGLGQPVCICGDRPCPFALTPPRNDSVPSQAPGSGSRKNKTGMNVGLSIAGAVLAGVGLGWLIFHYRQKKKQRLAAQSTETMSKDLLHPPSKSISTPPSSTFTRSIPSYPSSKSDFGRTSSYFGVQVFSYNELEEATNNFDPSRELGDGGFGTVYYGVLADGRVVAVKRLYENNFKRVEQFMNEVEILTRHRLDINLANMAVNKIQNRTLHELVDLSLGFETNSVVRRMATLVAELAFRCLQQERDMRPSMEEVLEVLRGIQNGDLNAHKVEVVDILIDGEVGPLKGSVAPSSPDSVITDKSVSTSTPNSSG
ncbi:unnamed protein product [Fraxinus pennsylvanica]|uniref:Protein kinase domain-containing protein n=1 Tax=Fraxinus pennsylvanica TaxID=56036 RepID=A0AAD2DNM3_9LAMI|nr:unnamed protein product [Fraxinus pennsylvanica]